MIKLIDKYIHFEGTCLSNEFPCQIKYENSIFFSSLHLLTYMKAMYFDNEDIADLIANTSTLEEVKELERGMNNVDLSCWIKHNEYYLNIAIYEKFKQNPK